MNADLEGVALEIKKFISELCSKKKLSAGLMPFAVKDGALVVNLSVRENSHPQFYKESFSNIAHKNKLSHLYLGREYLLPPEFIEEAIFLGVDYDGGMSCFLFESKDDYLYLKYEDTLLFRLKKDNN